MGEKSINFKDIWCACEKLRDVVFKDKLNILEYFKRNDRDNEGTVSAELFANILDRQIPDIGLSNDEISNLTEYFRHQRSVNHVDYLQFCAVIDDSTGTFNANDAVTGLEWEDVSHVNRLIPSERRRLDILLTHLATVVRRNDFIVWPHFRNYELEAKNSGTMTFGHFARILKFLHLNLSQNEFNLLVKRFVKDGYTICYLSFLKALDDYRARLSKENGDLSDFRADDRADAPDCVGVHLRRLPRPERLADAEAKAGELNEFDGKCLAYAMSRIKRHVEMNRIDVRPFFIDFDRMRYGSVTKAQFIRALGSIGLFGHRRMYIAESEVDLLCRKFVDHLDPGRINYIAFEKELEAAVAQKGEDRVEFIESTWIPALNQLPPDNQLDLCEQALLRIRARVVKRGLDIMPFLKSFDKHNSGRMTINQLQRCLASNTILIDADGIRALEQRFSDAVGFKYEEFMSEVLPKPPAQEDVPVPKIATPVTQKIDRNQLFAKIKKTVIIKGIQLHRFLSVFDIQNERSITKNNFRRGLRAAGVDLNAQEFEFICDLFPAKLDADSIDYKHFCQIFDPVENRPALEHTPLLEPIQYLPSEDGKWNFLNFEERLFLSNALKVLRDHCDSVSGLGALLSDFDKQHCGSITKNQLLRAFTLRNLNTLLSSREFDALFKCYSVIKGIHSEFNYRQFLQTLELLYTLK